MFVKKIDGIKIPFESIENTRKKQRKSITIKIARSIYENEETFTDGKSEKADNPLHVLLFVFGCILWYGK